jgi:uncharacterized membrane protein
MPFCTNCGTEVPPNGLFCGHCGRPQPQTGAYRPTVSAAGPFDNVSPRTASILCYVPVFGVIPAIIILASHRFRQNAIVRFNAFQSVYLFVAWLIVSTAIPIFQVMGGGLEHLMLSLLKVVFFVCWIILLVKASQEQQLHLPIIGDLAARSTSEQL